MVLAVLAGSVAAGDTGAPVLVACAAIAPLLGLVLTTALRERLAAPGPADLVIVGGLTLVLAANFVVVGDLARLLGLTGAHGLVAGAAIALAVIAWRTRDAYWAAAGVLGLALVMTPLVPVGLSAGPPWTVWAGLASRPAFTFEARGPWVTGGRALGERTTLTFTEPHRVVSASASTWRVTDDWPAPASVREWRVNAGDALTLRPGDQLTLERGARVRFEAGRRVPAAAASGVKWADGRAQAPIGRLLAMLGVAVTLLAGALVLAPSAPISRAAATGVPVAAGAFAVLGALWGLYGIAVVPELALVPRSLGPIAEALERVGGAGWRPILVAMLATGVGALLAGVVLAWRIRIMDLARATAASMGRAPLSDGALTGGAAALVVGAALLGLRDDDPWNLFSVGLGVIVAAAVAPRLAGGGSRSELAGAIVGVGAFVAVALDAGRYPGLALFAHHPVLVAAPAAWLAARCTRQAAR